MASERRGIQSRSPVAFVRLQASIDAHRELGNGDQIGSITAPSESQRQRLARVQFELVRLVCFSLGQGHELDPRVKQVFSSSRTEAIWSGPNVD